MNECTWTEDDNGTWQSSCGLSFEFFAGNPAENGFEFCPKCGRKILVQEDKQ